jgi:hypothetical protein
MVWRWTRLASWGGSVALFVACGGVSSEGGPPSGEAGNGGRAGSIQQAGRGNSVGGAGGTGTGGSAGNAGGSAGRNGGTGGTGGTSDEGGAGGTGGTNDVGGNAGEAQGGASWGERACDACTPTSDDPDCGDCPGYALRSSYGHTCLLGADRKVTCWGANFAYLFPEAFVDGASPHSLTFDRISAESGLDAFGRLLTWGYMDDVGRPSRMPGPFRFIAENGGCAIREDGAVQCGSTMIDGRFRSVATSRGAWCTVDDEGRPDCSGSEISTPPTGEFLRISIGGYEKTEQTPMGLLFFTASHACGILSDQTLACWGNDDFGQASPPSGTFRRVTSGGPQSCAIRTDGVTVCWGRVTSPPPDDTFVSISLDDEHGCGLRDDGKVRCWGSDWGFQLHPPPELAFESEHFTTFEAAGDEAHGETYGGYDIRGQTHACGLHEDATIGCWGAIEAPPTGRFLQVSSGPGSSCAVNVDSSLVCWGAARSYAGLLQEGATGGFEQVATGADSVCAVRSDGTLRCWESGDPLAHVPLPPPAGTFLKVSVSGGTMEDFEEGDGDRFGYACGLRTDGTIQCWGYASQGAFINPGWEDWTLTGAFVDLAVGWDCGIRADGSAACRSYELEGRFTRLSGGFGVRPDGTLVHADGEQLLEGNFVDVSAGQDYFCGLRSDGEVVCGKSRVR